MPERILTVGEEHAGSRLDVFLVLAGPYSRNAAQRLIVEGRVCVDSGEGRKNQRLRGGELVIVQEDAPVDSENAAEDIPLDIRYEDEDLLVVNKPRGLCVHPSPGHEAHTLVNGLLHHCGDSLSGIGGVKRPGIVHRIDKDTSGLLLVAKNDSAHTALSDMLRRHELLRSYVAIARGTVTPDKLVINAPLDRHKTDRKRRAVVPGGKPAVTHVEVLERFEGYSHLRCRLETGRTHQIRAHLKYLGHPLAGDTMYGGKKDELGFDAQALHAGTLGFHHPRSGEDMLFTSEPPEMFQSALNALRGQG